MDAGKLNELSELARESSVLHQLLAVLWHGMPEAEWTHFAIVTLTKANKDQQRRLVDVMSCLPPPPMILPRK